MRLRSRNALARFAALASLTLAVPVQGQSCPADGADRCAALRAAEDTLSVEERSLLEGLCKLKASGSGVAAGARWDALSSERRSWLLRRLAGWRLGAAALSLSLPPDSFGAADLPGAQCTRESGVAAKKKAVAASGDDLESCKASIEAQVRAYFDRFDTETSEPTGLYNCIRQSPKWTEFAKTYAPKDQDYSDNAGALTLLVFIGGMYDQIDLVVGDPHPTLLRAKRAAAVNQRGVYLALVPSGAMYSASIRRHLSCPASADEAPDFEQHLVDSTHGGEVESVQWLGSEENACLDLSVALEPSSAVYIDLARVDCQPRTSAKGPLVRRIRSYIGRSGWHELTVIGRSMSTGAEPFVLARRDISLAEAEPGRCRELRMDLSQKRFHDAVALLGVDTGRLCSSAGVDRARLHSAISDNLRKDLRRSVKDVETWTDMIAGLGDLKDGLRRLGGDAIGASRERMDVERALGEAGRELQRQGFATVLSASLDCARHGATDWEYSIVVRRLNLEKFIERQRDNVTGVDLDEVVDSKIEFTVDRAQLRSTLAKLLADVFQQPYLRFEEVPEAASFLAELGVAVDTRTAATRSDEPRKLVIAARPLSPVQAKRVCQRVALHGSLAGELPRGIDDGPWYASYESAVPTRSEALSYERGLLAGRPGPHLLYASLQSTRNGRVRSLAADYACIDLHERDPVFWLDVLPYLGPVTDDHLAASLNGYGALAAAGLPDSAFEAWLGYLRTQRSGSTLPSWDDLETANVEIAPDGRLEASYRVRADWALLGGGWRVNERLCSLIGGVACTPVLRRLGIALRVGGFGSVRFLDFSDLPSGVHEAKGARVRGDFGLSFQLGLHYAVSDDASIRVLAHAMLPWFADGLRTKESSRFRDTDYDRRWLVGLSIGLGFGSFPGVEP